MGINILGIHFCNTEENSAPVLVCCDVEYKISILSDDNMEPRHLEFTATR